MNPKKRTKLWKVIGLIVLVVLIGFFITFYVSFFGNPVMKIIARSELKQYLAENYHDRTDFELGEVTYNFKDGRYHAEVQSIKSPDTRFYVSWKRGDEVRDDYEDMVSSGQNTLARLQQEARQDIEAKLSELGETNVFVIMESFDEMPHFELDIPYRPGLIDTSNLHIELHREEYTAEIAAEDFPKIFLILEDEAPLPDNIFGKTYFAESTVDIFNEEYEVVKQTVEPGTILLNPNIFFMRNIGSRNNTVVHECVHWDRHDKFFEMQKLLNSDLTSLTCGITEQRGLKNNGIEGALQWMEWQANALTPRILLPANTTRKKLKEILLRLHIENSERSDSDIMEEAIEELADFFAVSKFAAKLRAIELGFSQAQGVWNYLNGTYLPSFSFKATALNKDESYIIDIRNACYEANFDISFKANLEKGDFIYVDYMYCINDEKYLEKSADGKCTLTSYARQHVDECCIKFKQKFKIAKTQGDAYYTQCSLCRDIDASSYCECTYIEDEDNQDVVQRAIELKKLKKEGERITGILRSLPMSFSGTLDAHMKRLKKEDGTKMTNLELALRTGLSDRYIQDLRKEEKNVSYETVCAICIGLHLHPKFSNDLIKKSRNDYPLKEEGYFGQFLIEHHYMETLDLCNEKLREMGYKTWGKDL